MELSVCRNARRILENIDNEFVGLDNQMQELEKIFRIWRETKTGNSVQLFVAGRCCGRSSVVHCLLERESKLSKNFEKHILHVSQLGSDAIAQNAISGAESTPRIIVLKCADELVSRTRQTLLYTFLDATRRLPWLLILMVNRHDFLGKLEKRVRSRLSTSRIVFTGARTFDEFHGAFKQFLHVDDKKAPDNWKTFISDFINRREVRNELNYMFQMTNSYGVLKSATAIFLGRLKDSDNPEGEAFQLLKAAVNTLAPVDTPFVSLLKGISLRTFCVFLCVLRRLVTAPPAATVEYRKAFVDYTNLCNLADKRLRVSDNSIIYKELDFLVRLRILHTDTKTNNISNRRVSLNADSFILTEAIKSRTIPSAIVEWYKTIPPN